MFKKSVSYLVLSSFLLMDAASCMEPEDKGPSSPPRSPRLLMDTSESPISPPSSSSSPGLLSLDPQERLQAISTLPWDEEGQKLRYKLLADFSLQEGISMALRREAFSSIYSTDLLDEATRERLENLTTIFLNAEELAFKDRFAFLSNSDEELPPVTTLLSLTKSLDSANDGSYEGWNVLRLIQLLTGYDRTESQEGIERCYFKQPALFLDGGAYDEWLRTTLERSDENKRASMLQKVREVMHSTEDVKKVATAAKFILQYSQDAVDKETALGAFFNIAAQQNAAHSEMPQEQSLRRKLDISGACNLLLPYAPEDKATLLKTLSEDMLQQTCAEISAIDPQERLQTISILPWNERNLPYAEFALKEDIPLALRREAFSSIYSTDSLDEVTRGRLENLKAIFLSDDELSLQERLKFLPNANEAAPSVTTLLSLTQALESANEESYSESDIRSLINFLMDCNSAESQQGIERCYFKQPELFFDGGAWEDRLRTIFEMSDESKRASMLQKLRELLHSTEDVKKVATAAKFILQYSQDAGDKETALGAFFNIATRESSSHSGMPQEQLLINKVNISEGCKVLLPYALEDKATLLRALSDDMLQQIRTEISEIIDPQERFQTISALPWEEDQNLRDQLCAELALKEDTPAALRREAFSSIYLIDSLDEITKERLKNLRATFLSDEELSVQERLSFLPNPEEEVPPVATLLSLLHALETENSDSSNLDDEEIYDDNGGSYKYALYHFLAECPDPEVQQRLENYYFNRPIATALYLKEWLYDFYKKSEENQKTLILQKMQEAIQAADMTLAILASAKFLLKHGQDHEPAIQALWKLVEEQTSKGSEVSEEEEEEEEYEKKDILITMCRTLLKYAPPSPVRESVVSRLFTEAEQELSPRALVLLLTQEAPSINIRARELAEQRLNQNNLYYTLDLFLNLEQKNLEQDLLHNIQERLKAKFNDSTDKELLLRLALAFLRATDENLSQKAFDYLKQVLIGNYNDLEDPQFVIYQIIGAVGVDHPWAQEVINIGIGIEQIDHPSSAMRGHRKLLKKIKEPVIHEVTPKGWTTIAQKNDRA